MARFVLPHGPMEHLPGTTPTPIYVAPRHRALGPAVAVIVAAGCAGWEDWEHQEANTGFVEQGSGGSGSGSGSGSGGDAFARFSESRLVSDDAFFDVGALDVDQVQRFFEVTPYGNRSFLADERLADGRTVAEALVAAAEQHGINPLVLLVTLQKESGLLSRAVRPAADLVDFALGCGCPDGRDCHEALRGIDRQLDCAAARLRAYADDIEEMGSSISGWAPGLTGHSLDNVHVHPANVATAVLYTYTPWVLEGRGGNWLFWNVWRRHASHLAYDRGLRFPFNEGFIGGACDTDFDCFYEGAMCLDTGGDTGRCSRACDTTCPDRPGPGWATTFCATVGGEGRCVAQCIAGDPPCDAGQRCERRARHSDPGVTRDVCLP